MFSSNQKKVQHDRGTKEGGKSPHGHRSSGSRDSGVGSSSASDRASPGTSPELHSSLRLDIESQKNRIRQLEASNAQLNAQLSDSIKENRAMKKERKELLEKIDLLSGDLKDAKRKAERAKRESPPHTSAAVQSSKLERRTSSAKKEAKENDARYQSNEKSQRRVSWRELPVPLYDERPPTAPKPPLNSAPNPFLPNPTSRPPSVSISYAPTAMYAPTQMPVAYATTPAFSSRSSRSPRSPRSPPDQYPNDGRYHHYPL